MSVFALAVLSANAQVPQLRKKQETPKTPTEIARERKEAADAADRAEAEAKKNEKTPQQIAWEKKEAADAADKAEAETKKNEKTPQQIAREKYQADAKAEQEAREAQANIQTNTDPSLPKLQVQTTDLKQATALAEEIKNMAGSKRIYKIEKVMPFNPPKRYTHRIIYSENGSEAENAIRIKIEFTALMEGANPALEKEGTLTYTLKSVEGKFLDILPFWKTYFDATGDEEEMVRTGGAGRYKKKIDGYEYSFHATRDNDGTWIIMNY